MRPLIQRFNWTPNQIRDLYLDDILTSLEIIRKENKEAKRQERLAKRKRRRY